MSAAGDGLTEPNLNFSSPFRRTIKRLIPFGISLLIFYGERDSNNQMRMSGGHSLAVGLDGGNTILCAQRRKGNESLSAYS